MLTDYRIIVLFRSHSQPKNYSEFPLNYHVSWHLHRILRVTLKDAMDVDGLEQLYLLDYQSMRAE